MSIQYIDDCSVMGSIADSPVMGEYVTVGSHYKGSETSCGS